MRVTKIPGGKKIIAFGPIHNGDYKYTTTVYEAGSKRLTVDTVSINNQRTTQTKMLTDNGNRLKEIVVEFVNGIRNKVYRTH